MYLSLCVKYTFWEPVFMVLEKFNTNFPFICSNIPGAPAYGIYLSQLI